MVRLNTVPPQEIDGIWYSWNLRNRRYEVDSYLTSQRNNKEVDRNLFKAITGIATLNPEALVGLGEGITGQGFDNLFKATSKMTDEEVALGISSIIAFMVAPSVGSRMAKGKSPTIKDIKDSPQFKKAFPNNDVNIDSAILTQKYIYDSSSPETRLRMEIQANEYRNTKLREEQRIAGEKGDMEEYSRIQAEINDSVNSEALNKLREIEAEKGERRKERENASKEEVISSLQEETGNNLTDEEWGDLYAMRFQKNPTREEFYDFKRTELEKEAESGQSPQSVVDAWYERYGTNEEGIDRDLQELGRRVMANLDTDGNGEINDFTPMDIYNSYSGAEREAIIDAFNEKSIWENWKNDYKRTLAGGAVAVGGSVAIAETGEKPEEISIEEQPEALLREEDEGEMELDEAVRDEKFITGEVEIDAGGEVVPPAPAPAPVPVLSPDERDEQEKLQVELEEEFFRQDKEFKNIDELLRLTYRASADAYETSIFSSDNLYLVDGYGVPVLFQRINNKLIVALRGTDSIENLVSDLYTTNPFTIGENKLDFYPFFRSRINEKSDIQFHAGFIKAMVEPPSERNRLRGKLESDYTPLYAMIRENIDNFVGEVTDLVFTGHSLGGALAGLCYYLYQNDTYNVEEKITNSVRCVTYGSPRFVIKGGEDYYNEICPNLIRVWNEMDIITYIPLNRGVSNINILSGFIHVGKSLCLDSPFSRSDPNQLIVNILQTENPMLRGMKGMTIEEGVDACNIVSGKEYQSNIFKGVLEQMGKGVEVIAPEEVILDMETKTLEELETGETVEEVYKGIGLEEMLKQAQVGEDERQRNFYYGSIFGFVMGTNAVSSKAHRLTTYKENIDTLIDLEINSKVDILEDAEARQKTEQNIVKEVVSLEIKEDIEQKIEGMSRIVPILGIIDDYNGMEIISVDNNV